MPPEEYQTIMHAMNEGFAGVHSRIDAFKDSFSEHQLACGKLFATIAAKEAERSATERTRATDAEKAEKNGIQWGKVWTALTIAVFSLMTIAALKIIFTNIGNFKW